MRLRSASATDLSAADRPDGRAKLTLFLILLLALAVRIGWAMSRPTDARAIDRLPDQREYLELGRSLLSAGGGQALRFFDPRFGQFVYAYRAPGYPMFVAACGGDVRIIRLVQALIDAATVLAAYWIARRRLSRRGALWAAAAVAVNPFLIYFCALVLSETLFAALLAWAVVLLAAGKSLNWPRLLAGMAILAIAVLVKPSAIALPALAGAGAIWVFWRDRSGRSARVSRDLVDSHPETCDARAAYGSYSQAGVPIKSNEPPPPHHAGTIGGRGEGGAGIWKPLALAGGAAILGALMTVAVLFPWARRNDRVLHRWIWTTTNGGITEYDGFNPAATGASNQVFVEDATKFPALYREIHRPDWNEVDRDQYFASMAKQWADAHPGIALQLAAVKIARTWSPIPLSHEYGRPLYEIVAACYAVPFDLLLLIGLIGRWPKSGAGAGGNGRAVKKLLLLPACYFTLVCAISVGSLRYLLPAEPLLAVFIGAAMMRVEKNGN